MSELPELPDGVQDLGVDLPEHLRRGLSHAPAKADWMEGGEMHGTNAN